MLSSKVSSMVTLPTTSSILTIGYHLELKPIAQSPINVYLGFQIYLTFTYIAVAGNKYKG